MKERVLGVLNVSCDDYVVGAHVHLTEVKGGRCRREDVRLRLYGPNKVEVLSL